MSLHEVITASIAAIGSVIALASLVKAVIEYQKQGIAKRSEIFLTMRSRLREDKSFPKYAIFWRETTPDFAKYHLRSVTVL